MIRSLRALPFALCLLTACEPKPAAVACQQDSDCPQGKQCRDALCTELPIDAGAGGGTATGGGTGTGGGTSTGGGTGTDAGMDAGCTPRTCAGLGCGIFADDCGGMLTCTSTCQCTEQNFDTTCPSLPCMTLSGCVNFACDYVPATCAQTDGGLQTCAPTPSCSGPGCGQVCTDADAGCDSKLYACGGGVCANVTSYCDPSPAVMNGKIIYANRCVAPPNVGCGTCQLGAQTCDLRADRYACAELEIPIADAGVVECDSTVSGSTFIYLDPAYTGTSDGSKMRPFTTFTAASTAANARGARGIIIGGNPTFTETLVVSNGVSIYGGFGVSPFFVPDASKRPLWNIPSTAVTSNVLLGATAANISLSTVLTHLEVRTANATANDGARGASNIAFRVLSSPALELDDVIITAGNAANGVDGLAGTAGNSGGNATGRTPGTVSCNGAPLLCTVSTPITGQDGNECGRGGKDQVSFGPPQGTAGNGGTATAPGGGRGVSTYDTDNCSLDVTVVTVGNFGGTGLSRSPASSGLPGLRVTMNALGVIAGGLATQGGNGTDGTFGGGGGAGGGYQDGCSPTEWGGPGAGGGAPGCGGRLGLPGGPGGLSIGLFIGGSPGFTVSRSVRVASGNGGTGGRGGAGGAGGSGGLGAASLCPSTNPAWRGKCGGAGGAGGRGGNGGSAGGSAGGDSMGIYCVGGAVPGVTGATVTVGTPGAGGQATTPAQPGVAGGNELTRGC